MLLPRRTVLSLSLAALATPVLLRPALAACQGADLAKGISFKRKDGTRGLARREGDGTVVIDYVTNRGYRVDQRKVQNGVFEIARIVQDEEEMVVGSSAPDYAWSYSPRTITPEDGATWKGRVKETREVTLSDENSTVNRSRDKWTASFRCFEPREVSLSGCDYQALTVEAEFTNDTGSRSQRWVYFPHLGLGLETRRDAVTNGLTALGPA